MLSNLINAKANLERLIVCPESDAWYIFQPNGKSPVSDRAEKEQNICHEAGQTTLLHLLASLTTQLTKLMRKMKTHVNKNYPKFHSAQT